MHKFLYGILHNLALSTGKIYKLFQSLNFTAMHVVLTAMYVTVLV